MKFFRHLRSIMHYIQLPKPQRQLTFYSEGKNYWPHLEGLVRGMLSDTDISVCYISSGADDPGLALEHANYHSFLIDESYLRNWLFENIDTDVMVMTMPDLHHYQLKRSKHPVHYVYVQHSLVSLHMVYRKGAFDHYDTIFCAGPHHVKEIRAMEAIYGLSAKILVEQGYGRLDAIIAEAAKRKKPDRPADAQKKVLIAPSWGKDSTIESGKGALIVDQLLAHGYQVTLRPHPQTIKLSFDKIDAILQKHDDNQSFTYEAFVDGQESLHTSDTMVSDWSGAALDYAFGLGKPVLFVDVPRKVNNPEYKALELEPIEVSIRDKIGGMWSDEINIDTDFCGRQALSEIRDEAVFNLGCSSKVGIEYLIKLITKPKT